MNLRRRTALAFSVGLVMLWLFGNVSVASAGESLSWGLVKKQIRRKFPAVRQLTANELAAWLKDTKRAQPLLLDVRSIEEFEVSHLPGAKRMNPDATAIDVSSRINNQATPVVAYCSVGYRSSALAQRLQNAGFTDVYNLEGSIFEWANSGRRVVRAGRPVRAVHPYNRVWGRLLRKELRSLENKF